jgi:cation-transporting ATPase E
VATHADHVTASTPRPLTDSEVRLRVKDGRVNEKVAKESRSVVSILASNVFTRFNAIITVMLVVILIFGHPIDAMFGIVMVVNALIGIVQELRAKRTLDRLTLLSAPKATVERASGRREIPVDQIVLDDVLILGRGQAVPVDASVLSSQSLEVSEALLTGEADAIPKDPGEAVLSGSFVVAGTGTCVVTAVGSDAYANKLALEARKFTLARSQLAEAINQILRLVTWLLIPTSLLLLWSQLNAGRSISDAAVATVSGVVAMVPQGLVLLVSMAFAVAVIRLGKHNVLVQELPAVETLARVDTLCVDKTGTLTDGTIALAEVVTLSDGAPAPDTVLGALAASDPDPNPTMRAIADAYPGGMALDVVARVPFSSERKISAVAFADGSGWMLGAPEYVLGNGMSVGLRQQIDEAAAGARRTIVVATADPSTIAAGHPEATEAMYLLEFAERVRPDAAATVSYFTDQGVELKVISGDAAATVAAVARAAGVPGNATIDATSLPSDPAALTRVATETAVYGRVTPEQKRDIVRALERAGRTVAMTGDGVNDVLSVKQADLGIAMGSGSGATRAVSQLVLLDDRFASLPQVVAEGRRVIANMERVASLFLTKTVYATVLAIMIGVIGLAFPFLPRQMTLIGSLTIGIPAFFLSFEPREQRVRSGFLPRVMAFAVPAGVVSGLATFTVYSVSRAPVFELSLQQSRTAATTMMVVLGLVVLYELIEPPDVQHVIMIAGLFGIYVFVIAFEPLRTLFALSVPQWQAWLVVAVVSLLAGAVMRVLIGGAEDWADRRLARSGGR